MMDCLAPTIPAHAGQGRGGVRAVVCRRLRASIGALCLVLAAALALPGARAQAQTPVQAAAAQQLAMERAFLTGLAALNAGNPELAIRLFRDILAIDPSLTRVRLELARAYFVAEQWSRSRSEFFAVLSGDLPEPVRANVLSFIRAIDSRRGFEWNLTLGLTTVGDGREFDSDVIGVAFGDVVLPFTFDRDGETALGLEASGTATLRRPIPGLSGPERSVTGRIQGFANLTDGPERRYDDLLVGLRAGLDVAQPRLTYSLGPVISQRRLAGERFEDSLGIEARFERRTAQGLSVFGSASAARLDNRSDDARDGALYRGEIGLRRSFGGRGVAGLALFGERQNVDLPTSNSQEVGLRAFGTFEARFGLTLQPRLSVSAKRFPVPSPLFVGDPDEREVSAGLRIEKNDLFFVDGFTPFVDVEATRVVSGIDAFSYRDSSFRFGFSRNF